MHRCLQVPEIVTLICEQFVAFDTNALSSERPRSLVALLRTCRAFHEPALRILWSRIDGLVPLLKCMPGDLWAIKNGAFKMKREIRPADWPRFRKHASLVRIFSPCSTGSPILDHPWYQNLHIASSGEPLLPNIRELAWSDNFRTTDAVAAFQFLSLFMGPNISTFSISYSSEDSSVAPLSLIANLPAKYPNLIAVAFNIEADAGHDVISTAVMGWNRLQRIAVDGLSPDALIHIASLPKLSTLTIGPSEDMILPTALPPCAFPALEKVSIDLERLSFSTQFLRLWPTCSRPLSRAEFRGDEDLTSTSTWTDIISILVDKLSPAILTCLTIEDYSYLRTDLDHDQIASHDFIIPAGSLRPLLSFSNLTNATLSASHGFDIDDAFILDVAKAWPRIEYLKFYSEFRPPFVPRVTLSSLVTLAQYCPLLYGIVISINAFDVPDIDINAPKVCLSALKILNVVHSPILPADNAKVAALLSDIFPNIERIDNWYTKFGGYRPADDYGSTWAEVKSLVETFVKVRKQEATRMNAHLAEARLA